jgi:hypothetical protein
MARLARADADIASASALHRFRNVVVDGFRQAFIGQANQAQS